MKEAVCEVSVHFGSFATGIDGRAAATVERLIQSDRNVAQVSRSPRGIEGEYTLCVRARSQAAAARLFDRVKQGLAEPVRAPVTVTGPQGSYSAPIAAKRHNGGN